MQQRSVVHIEIPAKDHAVTSKFYADLFGWEKHRDESLDYTMFKSGNIGGGYPEVGELAKAGEVIVYLGSEDIEADLKQIEAHGGKRLGEVVEVPGNGFMAFFSDPAGNKLALWQDINSG